MKSFRLCSFLLCLLFSPTLLQLTGCDSGPTEPDTSILWPMKVGNRWIGTKEYFDLEGISLGTERDTLEVVKSRVIDGELWYEFNDGALRRNRDNGVWFRVPGATGSGEASLIAKYPTTRSDTFATETYPPSSGQMGDTLTIWVATASVDSSLSIPYGNVKAHFYCSFYRSSSNGFIIKNSDIAAYIPGVGPAVSHIGLLGTPPFSDAVYAEWKLEKVVLK